MSGHFYIILKESIKYIPLLGQGMQLFNFIFMSRKWEKDKPRMAYRLGKLKQRIIGSNKLRPMWLLIFPEGTNLSDNGRANSAKWAAKQGLPDLRHQMIPRSTGLHFCLQELKGTVDYVYDCTMAYEGIPYGGYGEEYFTLRSSYFEGRPPKSVNMFWRRFAIDSIPLDTIEEFDVWLRARWTEKDDLLEEYVTTGRFPPSQDLEFQTEDEKGRLYAGHQGGFIETEMKPQYGFEILGVFGLVGGAGVAASLGVKALRYGKGLVGLA
jgi:1-acyl-sn-glycerol-3-phosphate acyltransferase